MLRPSGIAPLLVAAALLASCGDDDSEKKGGDPSTSTQALFDARELLPEVERDIVRRAKKEDKAAGNDPAAYRYRVECLTRSDAELSCRLDLIDKAGKTVNTVTYTADVDPDTGEFGYEVTANRDTRKAAGK